MLNILPAPLPDIDTIIKHSFKDYHVKGFDYLCLHRSEDITIKLYLFDGDVAKASEVVNPHDHRYNFQTLVLAGTLVNLIFVPTRDVSYPEYATFAYRTPLNGGNGFSEVGRNFLRLSHSTKYSKTRFCTSRHDQLHTIRVGSSQTALLLYQGPDVLGMREPTTTYVPPGKPAPSLSGLYNRFTRDEIRDRIAKLSRIMRTEIVVR